MIRRLLVMLSVSACLFVCDVAEADYPPYLILRPQAHHGHFAAPGRAIPVTPAPYAWGFFGAT